MFEKIVLKRGYFWFTPFISRGTSTCFAHSCPWGHCGAPPHMPPHVYSKPDCQAYGEQFSSVFICFLNRHLGHWCLLIISAYKSRTIRASDSVIQHSIPAVKLKRKRYPRCCSIAAMESGIVYWKRTRQKKSTYRVELSPLRWQILWLQQRILWEHYFSAQ